MPLKPNALSALAFALVVLGAISLFFSPSHDFLMLVGAGLFAVSGLLDALDGEVARFRGIASRKGDFIDHVLDRYADVIILVGMLSIAEPIFLLFAVEGILLTSYMGTQAQALGLGRLYGGIMGRADRLVIIILILIVDYLLNYHILNWGVLALAILSNYTAVERAIAIYRRLRD
jgi:phosphatidylglycerophosphate synthase